MSEEIVDAEIVEEKDVVNQVIQNSFHKFKYYVVFNSFKEQKVFTGSIIFNCDTEVCENMLKTMVEEIKKFNDCSEVIILNVISLFVSQ